MSQMEVTLGIDIGGTNTVFGLIDRQANCHIKNTIPTNGHKPAHEMFERLFNKFNKLYKELSDKFELKGIGIGAPNGNYYQGCIENPPNLSWGTINLVELVNKYFDLPVAVTNDANAAALGEMRFGAAKGMKNFIEITLGTGLGSGIVVDGNVVYGHDGFAGELGHTIVERNGRQCGCGRRGCLETYASANGARRTVFELLAKYTEESVLRDIPFKELTSEMIYDAAIKGDELAKETFEFTGRILGEALANTVACLSPEAIILFGGLASAGDYLFKPVRYHLEMNLLNVFKNKVKILPSGLPHGKAAVLGASALIWHELDH